MKTKGSILLGLLLAGSQLMAQHKGPTAYLSYASYQTETGKTYFETYLTMDGLSLVFDKGNPPQCKASISVQFSKKDSVILYDKYNLLSPAGADTNTKPDFSAIKRYILPKGTYTMTLTIKDVNNTTAKAVTVKGDVNVGYSSDRIDISDAELLSSFRPADHVSSLTKSGYDMVPYVYGTFPESMTGISFYTEIYNSYKIFPGAKFVVKYYLENATDSLALNDYSKVSVLSSDSIVPVLGGFDIQKLRTGKYNLVLQVIDKNNKVVKARKYAFFRYNPAAGIAAMRNNAASINIAGTFAERIPYKDSLREDVACLSPIGNSDERYFISKSKEEKDTMLLKRFFYNFWVSRNPSNPEQEWKNYKVQVDIVNKKFGTFNKKGYESDRGRVYLEYGAPTQRETSTINADSYPY
jgi:GWxTD domain-containing protein